VLRFAGGHKAVEEGGQRVVVPLGHQGGHVQRRADDGPPAEDTAPASAAPAVAAERRQADQGGKPATACATQFGQLGQ
jgi:hypothetical protein